MTIKKSLAAIESDLQDGESVLATVEASKMPASSGVRGVLVVTNSRIMFRATQLGRVVQVNWPLHRVISVDLAKNLMTAFVVVQVAGDSHSFRVKYNDAVPFAQAANKILGSLSN